MVKNENITYQQLLKIYKMSKLYSKSTFISEEKDNVEIKIDQKESENLFEQLKSEQKKENKLPKYIFNWLFISFNSKFYFKWNDIYVLKIYFIFIKSLSNNI